MFKVKLYLINFIINFLIFSISFLGIQNSNRKSHVNLFELESVKVPNGFILSLSFLLGTSTRSTLFVLFNDDKEIK